MLDKVKIDSHSIVHLSLAASYQSDHGRHSDVMHFEKFNVWRDIDLLPQDMQQSIIGQQDGFKQTFNYTVGELLMPYDGNMLHCISEQQFSRDPRPGLHLEPRVGRFYPRGWFGGVGGVFSEDMHPARLVGVEDNRMFVDFNHPLAEHGIDLTLQVHNINSQLNEHGGRCNDTIADLLNGPGMQLRYRGQPTDFIVDDPFSRVDASLDGAFYAMPRMTDHLDASALQQLAACYAELVPQQARVLDLMSSVNSHLSRVVDTEQVVGLGMNREELEANSRLDERVIHDLNQDPVLPFDNESFNVVVCSLSVEYLVKPQDVCAEVARVLEPGGLFIVSFSNRWFPPKVISLWTQLHEFERMGLVSDYMLSSGCFDQVNSRSLRGLPRPEDDRHALPLSDPLYLVWGRCR